MIGYLLKGALVVILFIIVFLCLGVLRTLYIENSAKNALFIMGKVPNPALDGRYQGSVGRDTSWLGKQFDAKGQDGINVFKYGAANTALRYPFTTLVGYGLINDRIEVLKIDYNVKGNPFWLRLVLDEVVEVKENEYLGKMELRIIPFYPFSVLFFELKK